MERALVNRVAPNGARYIVSKDRWRVEKVCEKKGIPPHWIRYHEKRKKYYLRLWGSFKRVGKDVGV